MISVKDLSWLIGLFEGEGCFYRRPGYNGGRPRPALCVSMTDYDVVTRAARLMSGRVHTKIDSRGNNKPTFRFDLHGSRAVEWMLTFYAGLGYRRRKKIRELLAMWRSQPQRQRRPDGTFFWSVV